MVRTREILRKMIRGNAECRAAGYTDNLAATVQLYLLVVSRMERVQ